MQKKSGTDNKKNDRQHRFGKKISGIIKRAVHYVTVGIWQDHGESKSRRGQWLIRQLRLIIYTVRGISQHESFVRSAALTFYTVMSLVPIMALAFGVIKGFGLDSRLSEYVIAQFPQYSDLTANLINFAGGVLERTRGGLVAAAGFVMLIWAAIRVFVNIENSFNNIWEVKKPRNIAKKAGAYFVVIFVLPILLVAVSGIFTSIQAVIARYSFLSNKALFTIGSLILVWLIFALAYKIIPNTKVRFRNAAIAAAIAAVAFMVFQAIYVYIRNGVNAYNIIYGSFAAIPLFLLWIQISWQILLLGAELSFAYQNVESYRQEMDALKVSYDNRRKITLATLLVVVQNFAESNRGAASEEISHRLHVSIRLVRDVLFNLESAGLVIAVKSDKNDKTNIYLPGRNIHDITFYGALQAVEAVGTHIDISSDSPELNKVSKVLDDIKADVSRSGNNMPLIELFGNGHSNNRKRKRS